MERFAQALASLLPQGYAWPRDASSVWMRLLRALAANFAELQAWIEQTVRQWQPHTAVNRLAEWELAVGLPDACFGADQSEALRRRLLLTKLRRQVLAYEDSSSACFAAVEAICLELGYPVTVAYNTPFRCGDPVGNRLGALDGQLYITVTIAASPFVCGDPVGKRLVEGSLTGGELVCYLQQVLPARFAPNYIFV
jgi:uncharacterized protein YmfQ (DUF2313 family)